MKYYLFIFFIYIATGKLFFNDNSSVNGNFQASSAAYIVALLTILFILFILFKTPKNLLKIKNNYIIIIPLLYYFYALLTTPFSLIPIVTIFQSMTGLGFVMIANSISKKINKMSFQNSISFLNKMIIIIIIAGIFTNLIFNLKNPNFNWLGIPSGYIALMVLYFSIYNLIDYFDYKKNKYLFRFIFITIFALYLNSFSAHLALFTSIAFLFFYKKKYFFLFTYLTLITIGLLLIITFLENNLDLVINNKSAGSYLIGSGRFAIYNISFELYDSLNIFRQIFGLGFMSERNLLSSYELAWSTDPHNSFIRSILGLGAIGGFFYLMFVLYPFIIYSRLKKINKNISLKWLMMHTMFLMYGITSSSYLGTPSIQLIIFIVFSQILIHNKRHYQCVK